MKIRRLLALVLVLTLALGVSAQGAGTAPDPNPTREDLSLDEILSRYDDHTHVAYADTHEWPASGTVCVEIAGVFTLSDLNGMTLPANLIIDVYQRYGGNMFRFVVRYDTTDGKSITVTDAEADAENGDKVAGFDDVSYTDYFADAVQWAVGEGVTQGTGNGAFSPKSTVTRAEAVTFLWRAAGSPTPSTSASSFTDVTDRNAYYYKAVLWAVEKDITNGAGGGRFNLTGTLAYDQIFTFLCRFAGEDASGSDWSAAAVAWARESGLTDGLSFTAKAACPRADVVYCLWKQLADDSGDDQEQQEEEQPPVLTDLQGAQAAIINGLLQLETQIDIKAYGLEASQAEALLAEILKVDGYDNYYGVTSYWCPQLEGQTAWTLQVRYQTSDPQQMEQNREVMAAVEQVVAQTVTAGMSDYDIAKALHDYLVLNCQYDMRLYSGGMPSTAYTAYGALVDHTAVCAGYAKAYELLMDAAGIPCEYITGYATGNHAWNLVQIDGEWYHVDTTWDDPTPDRAGYVRYDYFLKSDSYMRQNLHTKWSADYTCNSTKYDNANLLDSFEQAEQEEQQANKEAILQACTAALKQLPYQSQAEIQALTDDQLMDAWHPVLLLPEGQFTYHDVQMLQNEIRQLVSQYNPDYRMSYVQSNPLGVLIYRDDVQREQERRQENHAAESDARVQALIPILEQAVQACTAEEYRYSLDDAYTYNEIKEACAIVNADGYSFGGYTSEDYHLNPQHGYVIVTNRTWEGKQIQAYAQNIQDAIRRGDSEVTFPMEKDSSSIQKLYRAAVEQVGASGYSFDGYTAGVNYEIGQTRIRPAFDQDYKYEFVVAITYPDAGTEEQAPDPGTGTEQQTPDPGTGTEEQTPDPGTGTEQQTPDPGTGTEQQTPDPGTGTEEQTPDPGTGTEQQTSDPGTGTEQQTSDPGTGTEEQAQNTGAEA